MTYNSESGLEVPADNRSVIVSGYRLAVAELLYLYQILTAHIFSRTILMPNTDLTKLVASYAMLAHILADFGAFT